MKLGLFGARMDNTGLGVQTHGYYQNLKPTKTVVVDISKFNGNQQYPERYGNAPIGTVYFVVGFPQDSDVDEFLEGLDVVLIGESAYNPYLYTRARELGVKTAVAYNYEFFDWFDGTTPLPDMFIAPSRWHYNDVQKLCDERGLTHTYLHCPVDREKLPPRKIQEAKTFLHVAGKSAAHDRNGTKTVIDASLFLKTNAKIIVHFQGEQGLAHQATSSIQDYRDHASKIGAYNIEIAQGEYPNYEDIYKDADVLLLPRRYGGNCLPLNEALSVGMPAIMTDIEPNRGFLPADWLIPATKVGEFTPRTQVDIYGATPQDLADKIDWFASMSEDEMLEQNLKAGALARSISWETMAPQYRVELERLCTR